MRSLINFMATSSLCPASRTKTHPSATININSRLMIILFHSERHEHQIHRRQRMFFQLRQKIWKWWPSCYSVVVPMSMLRRPWYLHFPSIFPPRFDLSRDSCNNQTRVPFVSFTLSRIIKRWSICWPIRGGTCLGWQIGGEEGSCNIFRNLNSVKEFWDPSSGGGRGLTSTFWHNICKMQNHVEILIGKPSICPSQLSNNRYPNWIFNGGKSLNGH